MFATQRATSVGCSDERSESEGPEPSSTCFAGGSLLRNVSMGSSQPSDSIQQVKQKVNDKEGIPVTEQRLTFKGVLLEDGQILADYNISRDETLELNATETATTTTTTTATTTTTPPPATTSATSNSTTSTSVVAFPVAVEPFTSTPTSAAQESSTITLTASTIAAQPTTTLPTLSPPSARSSVQANAPTTAQTMATTVSGSSAQAPESLALTGFEAGPVLVLVGLFITLGYAIRRSAKPKRTGN